jgi:hypothetical protein
MSIATVTKPGIQAGIAPNQESSPGWPKISGEYMGERYGP